MTDIERRRSGVEAATRRLNLDQTGAGVPERRPESIEPVVRNPEAGVGHAQRTEEVVHEMIMQRPADHSGQQNAEDANE